MVRPTVEDDMINKYCISPTASILDAMKKIDSSAIATAVVCENRKVMGVLTDGDIRRALVTGATLSDSIETIYTRHFISVKPGALRVDVLEMMQARVIKQIPIVDENGELKGIHTMHSILGHSTKPNWAVIMAGGKGTRLHPITENVPKPMVPVAGRPILERIVLHLVGSGIRKIFLSINYLSHVIEDHFQDGSQFGCKIEYLREKEALGTGGALSLLPEIPTDPVLVMNGDLIVQADFNRMLHFHNAGKYYATMALRPYTHEIAFGCARTEGDRLVQLEEKPVLSKLVNAGIYILSPEAIEKVPENTFYPITQLFETALEENQCCGAYVMEEDWLDIGQPHQLRKANGYID